MDTIFFSSDMDIIKEWKDRYDIKSFLEFYDLESLYKNIKDMDNYIFVVDYDSISNELNKMISSDSLPKYTVVFERTPAIVTGKLLISHGVKAYGNSRMLSIHYKQLIETVLDKNIWTYPELTMALASSFRKNIVTEESLKFLDERLSEKEKDVVFAVLDGLTNDAIAHKFGITVRTVKAHISSIFSKLHVNDRLALVLLLK